MGSINAWNSAFSIEAISILSVFYGGGIFSAGYKVVPIVVQEQAPGSIAHRIFPTGSIEGSVVVFIPMALTINTGLGHLESTSTLTVSYARGMSISCMFVYVGFIVSSP